MVRPLALMRIEVGIEGDDLRRLSRLDLPELLVRLVAAGAGALVVSANNIFF